MDLNEKRVIAMRSKVLRGWFEPILNKHIYRLKHNAPNLSQLQTIMCQHAMSTSLTEPTNTDVSQQVKYIQQLSANRARNHPDLSTPSAEVIQKSGRSGNDATTWDLWLETTSVAKAVLLGSLLTKVSHQCTSTSLSTAFKGLIQIWNGLQLLNNPQQESSCLYSLATIYSI